MPRWSMQEELEHKHGHLRGTPKEPWLLNMLELAKAADFQEETRVLGMAWTKTQRHPYVPIVLPGPIELMAYVMHPEWEIFAPWRLLAAREEDRQVGQGD